MNQSTVKWSTWSNDSSRKNPISVIFLYIESFAFPSKWKWKWKREILACLCPVRAFICLCLQRHSNERELKWNTYGWTSLVLFQIDTCRYLLMAKQDKGLACRQFIIRSMYVTTKTTTKQHLPITRMKTKRLSRQPTIGRLTFDYFVTKTAYNRYLFSDKNWRNWWTAFKTNQF